MISEFHIRTLSNKIKSFFPVNDEFIAALSKCLRIYHYPKTEHILRKGRKQEFAWFILQGFAREITQLDYMDTGYTSWFWFPHDFIFAYPVFFNRKEAVSEIEVLAGTTVLEIKFTDILVLLEAFTEVSPLMEELRYHDDLARIRHAEDLFVRSAKERYKIFYNMHPSLFNVAKHKDIASFLGIKDIGFRRYFSILP